jgi:hypothetical protein
MRVLAVLVAIVALSVLPLVTTTCAVLCSLDGRDIAIAPLVRGDLSELLASATFWRAFPYLGHVETLLAFGPAACMAFVAAFLFAAARRWPHVPNAVLALLALVSGGVPYAVGAIALRDNTVPEVTGRWLMWMLGGPLYAALLSLGVLARGVLSRRAHAAAPVAAHAA